MSKTTNVSTINDVVIRFAGDSGMGCSYRALSSRMWQRFWAIRSLPSPITLRRSGHPRELGWGLELSGKDWHRGVYTPGDYADVLVAMNPSALKVNVKAIKNNATIIYDSSAFDASGLKKGSTRRRILSWSLG